MPFIQYINDNCNCSKILIFILFADDTSSFHTSSNISELCKTVTDELEKAKIWFHRDKVSLKVSKTHFMKMSKL